MTDAELRIESPSDLESISSVTELAFRDRPYAGGDEQDVIDRLRASGALTLSLVAILEGELVGQITFSPATLSDGTGPWFALGPVSVLPEHQGEGIGSQLINQGLSTMEELGALGCILTGNPVYYCRFGFEVSPDHAPENEPAEYFQLKLIGAEKAEGTFCFHPAFYDDDQTRRKI